MEYCDWDRDGSMKIPETTEQGITIEKNYVRTVCHRVANNLNEKKKKK